MVQGQKFKPEPQPEHLPDDEGANVIIYEFNTMAMLLGSPVSIRIQLLIRKDLAKDLLDLESSLPVPGVGAGIVRHAMQKISPDLHR